MTKFNPLMLPSTKPQVAQKLCKKILRLLNGQPWTGGGPALKSALPDFLAPKVESFPGQRLSLIRFSKLGMG